MSKAGCEIKSESVNNGICEINSSDVNNQSMESKRK